MRKVKPGQRRERSLCEECGFDLGLWKEWNFVLGILKTFEEKAVWSVSEFPIMLPKLLSSSLINSFASL